MVLFEIKDLSFTYPGEKNKTLDSVSLSVKRGDFLVLCGPSGCGKTTLLRHFKPAVTPHGERSGSLLYKNTPLEKTAERVLAEEIGFVFQDPDSQIVTDKVWHELAFSLESLGLESGVIRRRVAEMASFFGITEWFERDVSTLSGGQKQLLNLASVMATSPEVLVLDEPTAQLDPIAAADFLSTLVRINRELATTVILSEHRLEEILPYTDRMAVMEDGRLTADGSPQEVGELLKSSGSRMYGAMPAAMRIYSALDSGGRCPVSVREGIEYLSRAVTCGGEIKREPFPESEPAAELKDVWFRYEKSSPDILRDLNLTVPKGSFFAVVGANGAGKSTMLSLIAGLNTPYRGSVRLFGRKIEKYKESELYPKTVALLPQNPMSLFTANSVREELETAAKAHGVTAEDMEKTARITGCGEFLERHPYDLSGGERQRAALAALIMTKPKILLLDEPTKGLDAAYKKELADILKSLCSNGATVIAVSHDIEFCAEYADICALVFAGSAAACGEAREFFAGNSFYTTAANRISRRFFKNAVTNDEVVYLCRKQKENTDGARQ